MEQISLLMSTLTLAVFVYLLVFYNRISTARKLDVKNIVNVLHEAEFADGDWELLGLQLIKHADLTTIKANRHGEASLCMMDMVSQWLRNELEPSWNKLAEAVEKVGKYGKATAQVVQRKAGIGKTDIVHIHCISEA